MDTKALRQKILDLAIRGKLVPQDPNDEPASALLEHVRAEKQQMVKDGKLKPKDIKNDTIIFKGEDNLHYEQFQDGTVKCIEDEVPFELPDGWEWTRIQNITQICLGLTHTPKYVESGIPFYSVKDISSGGLDTTNPKYISVAEFEKFPDGAKPQYGDILFGRVGTLGKPTIVNINSPFGIFVSLGFFRKYSHEITSKFLVHWMNSSLFWDQVNMNVKGAVLTNLNTSWLSKFLIPIPPSKEQARIVAQREITIRYIEKIENTGIEVSNLITTAKSKILDLAIRGKLVPQDPTDEPASMLLERIREEKEELIKQGKIKRDKKKSVIFKGEDNSYYGIHLPDGWNWAILKDISFSISDGSHNPPSDKGFGVPLLSAANINNNSVLIDNATRWITNEEWEIENQRTNIEMGDVLLTIVGSIGRSAVVETKEHFALQRSVAVIKPCFIIPFYLMHIFQAPQIKKWLNDNSKGTAQKGIYLNAISMMAVPIPPLEEQSRIVEQITVAFDQLDLISNALL